MKACSDNIQRIALIFLLFLVTLGFFYSPGTGDVKYWLQWMTIFDAEGPFTGFQTTQWDYPPFSSVILYGTARMTHLLSIDYFTSLKLSITLFLFISSLVFWVWTRDLIVTAIFHLSLLLNSVLLVYIDIFFAPLFVSSLWALKKRRLTLFTVLYSFACLIKWQPIVISPFILLYILNITRTDDLNKIDYTRLIVSVLSPLIIIVVFTLYLYNVYLLKSFVTGLTSTWFSGNALNFSWIMTYFLHVFYPDIFGPLKDGEASFIVTGSFKVMAIPKALFVFFYTSTFLSFFRRDKNFENLILYSLAGFLAYFIFNTGVHENHLFVAAILAVILFFLSRDHSLTSLIIITISNMNLMIFYGSDGKGLGFSRVVGLDITLFLSLFNVFFFLYVWNKNVRYRKTVETGMNQANN